MNFDEFLKAYLICALWSSTDDAGDPLDDNYSVDDVSEALRTSSTEECRDFFDANAELLAIALEKFAFGSSSAGNDFWLTRNGHGAGFWDRGLGDVGDRLSEASKVYGGVDLCVGDDGKIYG